MIKPFTICLALVNALEVVAVVYNQRPENVIIRRQLMVENTALVPEKIINHVIHKTVH